MSLLGNDVKGALLAVLFAAFVAFAPAAQASGPDLVHSEVDSPKGAPNPYIVGGSDTTFDKHPWQVQITLNGQPFCGGFLIHPMIVMTAAHCLVDDNLNWWHNQGTMAAFTGRTLSGSGGEQLNLSSAWRADNYVPSTIDNDYGFLTLSSPSSRPQIKIAGPGERAVWRAGRTGVVSGFGDVSEGGTGSPVLKALNVPVIDDSVCSGENVYGASFRANSMLCAGIMAGGAGSCQGDSGGALQMPIDGGGYRATGIVSWGDGCARPNSPTVYTRIAEPSYSTVIAAKVREIEQTENFPGVNNGVAVVGSGARPAGCGVADAAAKKAAAAVTNRNKRSAAAKKAVRKAKTGLRKAKRQGKAKLRRAKAKLKKTQKRARTTANAAKKAKANSAKAAAAASTACN